MTSMLDAHATESLNQPLAEPAGLNHDRCGCYSGWGVIQTHPQAEVWAVANLARQGYRTYLPRYVAIRRDPVLRSSLRTVERPLFPTYAFVAIDPRDPWYPIRRSPGIRQLMLSEFGKPHILRPGVLAAVRATEAQRAIPLPESPSWASGMACSLRMGLPLAGLPAVVLSTTKRSAHIAVMFMGGLRRVSVPLDQLSPRTA